MAKKSLKQLEGETDKDVETRQVNAAISHFNANKLPIETRHKADCAVHERTGQCACGGILFDPNVGPLHRNILEGS